jgi:hypothetical protein
MKRFRVGASEEWFTVPLSRRRSKTHSKISLGLMTEQSAAEPSVRIANEIVKVSRSVWIK